MFARLSSYLRECTGTRGGAARRAPLGGIWEFRRVARHREAEAGLANTWARVNGRIDGDGHEAPLARGSPGTTRTFATAFR